MNTYPGGKASPGVYQRIINQFPPHDTYTEGFAGGAAILRHKRPARSNAAIDIDPVPLAQLASMNPPIPPGTILINSSSVDVLSGGTRSWTKNDLIYLDPPYPYCSRAGERRQIYRHEFGELEEHRKLLDIATLIPAMVAISSYPNDLYSEMLAGWRKIEYNAQTRGGGSRVEVLWLNYPEPRELHEYTYLGNNKREREVIRRRIQRWRLRLERMSDLDRLAMVAAMSDYGRADLFTGSSKHLSPR